MEKTISFNNTIITVKNWIPYKEKVEFATLYASSVFGADDDENTVIESLYSIPMAFWFILQFYTNFDLSKYDANNISSVMELYDTFHNPENEETTHEIYDMVAEDFEKVNEIFEIVSDNMIRSFEARNSLGGKIKTMMGTILDNEDIATSISKISGISEFMIDIMKNKDMSPATQNVVSLFQKRDID